MFWHIVKFRFAPEVPDEERRRSEDEVRAMPGQIAAIRFLRLARSADEQDVTGMVMGFDDAESYAGYQSHPVHVPVGQHIDGLCSQVERVDFVTDDDPATFG